MTTHGTFDSVPAPNAHDPLTRPPSPHFHPFVGVTEDRLVTIVARTRAGLYRDARGYLYIPATIARDLSGYAERRAADSEHRIRDEDARDEYNTQRGDDGRDELFDPHLDAFA